MNAREKLARNLRRIRVARGLSQERLAIDAGIDRAYCGGLERMAENPTVDLLDKLAMALKVEVGELLATPETGEMPANLRAGRKPL